MSCMKLYGYHNYCVYGNGMVNHNYCKINMYGNCMTNHIIRLTCIVTVWLKIQMCSNCTVQLTIPGVLLTMKAPDAVEMVYINMDPLHL